MTEGGQGSAPRPQTVPSTALDSKTGPAALAAAGGKKDDVTLD
ncbi:hypothetical protein SAQ01S_32060 [Sphingomonas aquatilis NBRC 16722]|uniref:Uncharacterized protein n=1 Tax=Sphingomonas aquatilis TaxID=93063 RepID=A0AAW3TLR7_9SPHN|nr:hypothetical protein [Sphingomonas aquatilis]GEM73440.1 hypothetical protein SAQ01S_32060 [Sphingomonas aquatilis NBRC 16722]